MYAIYDDVEGNLKEFIADLDEDYLKEALYPDTLKKGKSYYAGKAIKSAIFTNENSLDAVVMGQSNYKVRINIEDGVLGAVCNCPVGGICKHIAAVFYYAMNEPVGEVREVNLVNKKIWTHLDSLDKNTLIELVIKYAPENYFISIMNNYADRDEALEVLEKVSDSLDPFYYQRGGYDDDFSELEEEFEDIFSRLSGLERLLAPELGELIIDTIRNTDAAIEDGNLYDYRHDMSFECPDNFLEITKTYAGALPYPEKIAFLNQLNETLSEMNYSTYAHLNEVCRDMFSPEELPRIKKLLLDNLSTFSRRLKTQYYNEVNGIMSFQEKEKVLMTLKEGSPDYFMELCQLLHQNNQLSKAREMLEKWLDNKPGYYGNNEEYFILFEMYQEEGLSLEKVALKAIKNGPTINMLDRLNELMPSNMPDYENIAKKERPGTLLEYLEKHGRYDEAFALIKDNKNIENRSKLNFLINHKNKYPQNAESFFYQELVKNLEHAGDNYYDMVATMLRHIMELNPVRGRELVSGIRNNYKRRKNLIIRINNL